MDPDHTPPHPEFRLFRWVYISFINRERDIRFCRVQVFELLADFLGKRCDIVVTIRDVQEFAEVGHLTCVVFYGDDNLQAELWESDSRRHELDSLFDCGVCAVSRRGINGEVRLP